MNKCIDKGLLQKYIDDECSENESLAIKKHLQACPQCHKEYERRKQISSKIKYLLADTVYDNTEIPEFGHHEGARCRDEARPVSMCHTRAYHKLQPTRKMAIWLSLAAAGIVLLLVLILPNNNKIDEINPEYLFYVYADDYDANLPLSGQDFIIAIESLNETEIDN